MNRLVIAAAVAAAGWWWFVGGRTLSEDDVVRFYRHHQAAQLKRDPEALCAELADEFRSIGTTTAGGRTVVEEHDKRRYCESTRQLYASWAKLGETMGGMLQLDSGQDIHGIEIAKDGRTAVVDISSTLDVGGTLTNIRWRSQDTLARRNGKVLLVRSEGSGTVGAGGRQPTRF